MKVRKNQRPVSAGSFRQARISFGPIVAVLVLAACCSKEDSHQVAGDEPHRFYRDEWQRLEIAWRSLANSAGTHREAKDTLLTAGEPSLEVLLDLLYGEAVEHQELSEADVARLIEQLGADDFQEREAATQRLSAAGPSAAAQLQRAAAHANAEVRYRARLITGSLEKRLERYTASTLHTALVRPATQLLEVDWPLEQLQKVARRNARRLSHVTSVGYSAAESPLSPLLGSLRYSSNPKDHHLLRNLADADNGPLRKLTSKLMQSGLTDRRRADVAPHWKQLPPVHGPDSTSMPKLD